MRHTPNLSVICCVACECQWGKCMGDLPSYSRGTASVLTHEFTPRVLAEYVALAPRNAVLSFLDAYRTVISPMYGDVCRHYPSCSAYAVGSVQQRGALIGSALAGWRILRCNPFSSGGVDDVRHKDNFRFQLTRRGYVVPSSHRKD